MSLWVFSVVFLVLSYQPTGSSAEQCGDLGDLGSIIPRSQYDEMFKHRKDCTSKGFYSYDPFISAAKSYPAFATTGDTATRKREVAAFLAQTSHETTEVWTSHRSRLDKQSRPSHNQCSDSFKSAFWFWMTPQSPKPSCHNVITGRWQPSAADRSAGRVPGYDVITNIINGGECSHGKDSRVDDRIGYYKRYCNILGVGYGNNLDCYRQKSFGNGLLLECM
ncbi:hypothetical protein LWI29_016456 [Acer saccharum]|uniref:Glycoside hydrolase family 19 catalytic domain-containing protein n=1 Tax=Acer saccharum TaxID=4024 RepID=A0AA39RV13_ACESA|nr:hypothetical protein LWI29_016456 [Acer saccharum]